MVKVMRKSFQKSGAKLAAWKGPKSPSHNPYRVSFTKIEQRQAKEFEGELCTFFNGE
jgi:hypothetical protein